MKILVMCQGGHVRSVALKYVLTYKYGHEALACGWESNSRETIEMLCAWADAIVIMQADMERHIPAHHHNTGTGRKLFCYDVGPDRFGNAFHPVLQQAIDGMIRQHGIFYTTHKIRDSARKIRERKHQQ